MASSSSSAPATDSTGKKITLVSSDGEIFVVEEAAATQSLILKDAMEDTDDSTTIPVSIVKGKILEKVIEYCKYHSKKKVGQLHVDSNIASTSAAWSGDDDREKTKMEKDEIALWNKKFIDVDTDTLYFLTQAANYLNIKGLLDLCCEKVAQLIRGKKPEEIRIIFNIKNDFTPEEEQQIRNENAWAFDD